MLFLQRGRPAAGALIGTRLSVSRTAGAADPTRSGFRLAGRWIPL